MLNHNAALVNIDDHREAIVRGKGVAFNKRKGDPVSADRVEKIFYLNTATARENLFLLLKDIPIDVVTTTYEIIDMARSRFHVRILDYIYITLSDHILGAYTRMQAGTYKETMVPDLRQHYPHEYAVADVALDIIQRNLKVNFPESEVRSLALHFINASGDVNAATADDDTSDAGRDTTEAVNNIVLDVLNHHNIYRSAKNGNYYDRFMIHLQYLVDRIRHLETDQTQLAPEVEEDYQRMYPQSYAIGVEIFNRIRAELFAGISNNERLYFIIHIQRLLGEKPQKFCKE
ncbi:Transcription antiterminator lacT [Lacticaseibacillus thailandensis DSM 22698 = JCM 13996]|uniref:Transcription antiterminator lacT n=1 Tax=Lacticaseibacillus thailandensis DSM 22698 = JCM 13996 TaxID=1423810 RepID=A0A0R2C5Y3_9LACO|nr:Transcription antiterminator lacT [Lacticaseibacillus thailandensis DSM 22698 = JCM 13996]